MSKPVEWKQAAGNAGYQVTGPVWGAYVNGVALFVFQSADYWTCVVTGQLSTSGATKEEAMKNGEDWANKLGTREADRRITRDQFEAILFQ